MDEQATIVQQQELLSTYRQTLAYELRRAARYGGEVLAPPEVAHGIATARDEIARIKAWLQQQNISTADNPDDFSRYPDLAHSQQHESVWVAAPPLPPHYVPRVAELDALRKLTIQAAGSSVPLVAVFGMGGVGKSALTIALCHDPEVQQRFPDGVVWVSIGRGALAATDALRTVGEALGDPATYYDTEQTGAARLRLLLRNRAVLIVLDDVWDAARVEPFLLGALGCVIVLTTRDRTVALSLSATELRLGVLKPTQATDLLRAWAGRDDPDMPKIIGRLGGLPLALKLAGARLREGLSGAEWLRSFRQVSQMKLGRRSSNPHESLEVCFELSLARLDEAARELYVTLGIFPEDTTVPQHVVVRLWHTLNPQISEFESHELIVDFSRLALLDHDPATHTIAMHDLLHNYTVGKLGDRQVPTHVALLLMYNPLNQPWPQIPHDGYLYHQLVYHLLGANLVDQMHALLLDSPAWMEAKADLFGDHAAYTADLDMAIRRLEDPLDADGLLLLTRLYTAFQVVHARTQIYNDEDLEVLTWLGREREAINHARMRRDISDRFLSLCTIYRVCHERGRPQPHLLNELKQMAHATTDVYDWPRMVAQITEFEEPETRIQLIADSVERAHQIEEPGPRVLAVTRLAVATHQHTQLSPGSLLDEITSLTNQVGATEVQRQVVTLLARGGLHDHAWSIMQQLPTPAQQVLALASIVNAMLTANRDVDLTASITQMRASARSLGQGESDNALVTLARVLQEHGRFEEAHELAEEIQSEKIRLQIRPAFAAITRLAREGRISEAEAACLEITDPDQRIDALRLLIEALPHDHGIDHLIEQARVTARSFREEQSSRRLRVLCSTLITKGHVADTEHIVADISHESYADAVRRELAAVDVNAGRMDQALDRIRTMKTRGEQLAATRYLAKAAAKTGQPSRATAALDEIVHISRERDATSKHVIVLSMLAHASAQRGVVDSASWFFDEAERVAGLLKQADNTAARKYQAVALVQTGECDRAAEVARLIKRPFERWKVQYRVAVAAAKSGQLELAEQVSSEIGDNWRMPSARYHIAAALFASGHIRDATDAFEHAVDEVRRLQEQGTESLRLSSWGEPSRRALLQCLARCGMFREAEALATNYRDALAIEYVRVGRIDQALHEYNQTQSGMLGAVLVPALIQQQRWDEAELVARSASAVVDRIALLSRLASYAGNANMRERAISALSEARLIMEKITIQQAREDARRSLATGFAEIGLMTQAYRMLGSCDLADFIGALIHWSRIFDRTYSGLGITVCRAAFEIACWDDPHWDGIVDRLADTVGDTIVSVLDEPHTPAGELPIGPKLAALIALEQANAAKQAGDLATAETHFTRAIALDEQWAESIGARGVLRGEIGQYESAIEDLNRAIELGTSMRMQATRFLSRGIILQARGDDEAALSDFESAINLYPNQSSHIAWRAGARWQCGDYAGAIDDITKCIELMPEERIHIYWRALYRLGMGQYHLALADLNRDYISENSELFLDRIYNTIWCGVIYNVIGNIAEANECWQSAHLEIDAHSEDPGSARAKLVLAAVMDTYVPDMLTCLVSMSAQSRALLRGYFHILSVLYPGNPSIRDLCFHLGVKIMKDTPGGK